MNLGSQSNDISWTDDFAQVAVAMENNTAEINQQGADSIVFVVMDEQSPQQFGTCEVQIDVRVTQQAVPPTITLTANGQENGITRPDSGDVIIQWTVTGYTGCMAYYQDGDGIHAGLPMFPNGIDILDVDDITESVLLCGSM